MKAGVIWLVASKEMRDLLRDRRTIFSMIIIPVLALPLIITAIGWLTSSSLEKLHEEKATVIVRDGGNDPALLASLEAMEGRFTFQRDSLAQLPVDSLLTRKGVRLVMQFGPGLDRALDRLDSPVDTVQAPTVRLFYDSTDDAAQMAGRELSAQLMSLREESLQAWLKEHGLRPDLTRPWDVEHVEMAPPERKAAEMAARFLPYIILILCIQGAMYPAMDLTAGEKERNTIETLLVNPVSRLDIVLGKYAATAIMAMGSALFTLGGQFAYLHFAGEHMIEGGLPFTIDPAALGLGLILLLPVALLFSALMLALCIRARSMKEAQSYMGPLMMLVIFPSMASMVPGLKLTGALAFAPVFNVTLLMRDVLRQDFGQPGLMALVFVVNMGYAALALWTAVRMFSKEEVIFRS
jgi:sodium transport system permease protein